MSVPSKEVIGVRLEASQTSWSERPTLVAIGWPSCKIVVRTDGKRLVTVEGDAAHEGEMWFLVHMANNLVLAAPVKRPRRRTGGYGPLTVMIPPELEGKLTVKLRGDRGA